MKIKFNVTKLAVLMIIPIAIISCNELNQADTNIESATMYVITSTTEHNFNEILNYNIQELNAEITELYLQLQELNNEIAELKLRANKNFSYEIFYGEWELTDRIYVDPVPFRGLYYTDDELNAKVENLIEDTLAKKIQFAWKNVVINGDEVIDNIKYNIKIFSANDDYKLHYTMTLKDIGLTEANGNYFAFVEVRSGEYYAFEGSEFFIKDENTLVMYRGSYCIEYIRISYDGGSESPVIING